MFSRAAVAALLGAVVVWSAGGGPLASLMMGVLSALGAVALERWRSP
ncbi:MAG: hypothetical protein OWU84_03270 [Firmicutes bacterium]|nr:hypothetical protein [Bacillota bacterium]